MTHTYPKLFKSLGIQVLFLTICSFSSFAGPKNRDIISSETNKTDGTYTSVTVSGSAGWQPTDMADLYGDIFGAKHTVLKLVNTTTTRQGTVIDRYAQFYKDIEVKHSSFAVMSKGNVINFITCNYYKVTEDITAVPVLPESEAREKALAQVNAEKYIWQEEGMERNLKLQTHNLDTTYYPRGTLVWIEDNILARDRKLHLAYAFNIYALIPLSRDIVYVDATSGQILSVDPLLANTSGTGNSLYSGPVGFEATLVGSSYALKDATRGGGINTYTCAGGGIPAAYNVLSSTTTFPTDATVDAHWGAEKVYDYWNLVQGRNSYNNAGAPINSYVHYGVAYDNAFWDGYEMVYGDGSGIAYGGFSALTSLDVCAHEIGHAVCQYTSGLAYNKESGAMNEGFSDIWAAVIEEYADPHETDAVAKDKWKIGEEISASSLRRMDNPNLKNQPDTYGGTYWYGVTGCVPSSSNDYCGVHTNSGVLNYWFYLVCNGGSGTNDIGNAFSVTGIGTTEGANIAYQTELVLASTADFAACRTASINVATILYGACSPEVAAVTKAWYAVGVGAAYTGSSTSPITGTAMACVGSTTTLSNATPGGTWTSSSTSIATIISSTGIATGVAAGTAIISYSTGGSCSATKIITINSAVSAGTISGTALICTGSTLLLTSTVSGGTWSSSTPAVATAVSSSGVITGFAPGTATITYTATNGCGTTFTTAIVTVNSVPVITGTPLICVGATTTMSCATPGGTWISSSTTVATVGSSTGVVTGISPGTAIISYILSSGCQATVVVTVNSSTPIYTSDIPIVGLLGWYPFNGNANNWYGTGKNGTVSGPVLTTDRFGNPNSAYHFNGNLDNITIDTTFFNTGWSQYAISVWLNSDTISNPFNGNHNQGIINTVPHRGLEIYFNWGLTGKYGLLAGSNPPAGLWDIFGLSNVSQANVTVHAWKHVVLVKNGLNYKFYLNGVRDTQYTVGTSALTYYNKMIIGNIDPSIAHEGFFGKLDDVGFWNRALTDSEVLRLYQGMPGDGSVCVGSTITLTNPTGGGTWSSSNTAVATIGSSSGVATGMAAGTTVISYIYGSGCLSVMTLNVVSSTSVTISGPTTVAPGSTIILSSSYGGGTWSSSNTSVAVVGSGTGIVTGIAYGTVTISYTGTNACGPYVATTNITVSCGSYGTINTIAGAGPLGFGAGGFGGDGGLATSGFINTPGQTYTDAAGNVYIADNMNGRVRKITAATGIITTIAGGGGTLGDGGPATSASLINPFSVWLDRDGNIYATDQGHNRVRKINATTGIITTVAGGGASTADGVLATSAQLYSPNGMCLDTAGNIFVCDFNNHKVRKINAATGIITTVAGNGVPSFGGDGGPGPSARLNNPCQVYVDKAGNIFIADLNNNRIRKVNGTTGIITTIAGTGVTGYSGDGGPATSAAMYQPNGVFGDEAGNIYISDWHNNRARKVAAGTGIITTIAGTGVAGFSGDGGPATSATLRNLTFVGWDAAENIYITDQENNRIRKINGPGLFPITGTPVLCVGTTTTLSNASPGGTWTSSTFGVATVGTSTGIVAGMAVGTSTITYNAPGGCKATIVVTVVAAPTAITGPTTMCVGTSGTLSNTVAGGAWSSSNIAVAVIGSSSGLISAIAVGTSNITYALGAGCRSTVTVTVVPVPSAITGTLTVCSGMSTTLGTSSAGGTWTSSNLAIATVGSGTGIVNGIAAGTSTITYAISAGCFATAVVTVTTGTASITGTLTLCSGSTSTLSNTTAGGTWSSGNIPVAGIGSSTGVVTGASAGTAIITYALSGGCNAQATVTVTAMPAAITGNAFTCVGLTTTLSNTVTGGSWSSGNIPVATVGSATGIVTGASGGTATITYSMGGSCYATLVVTVTPAPSSVTGTMTLCAGGTTTLSDASSGGTWSSGNLAVANVGSGNGVVSGVTGGTATISYSLSSSCVASAVVTVIATPAPITGSTTICNGTTTTLSDATPGGNWSSSNIAIASISAASGIVTGAALGTATITYMLPAGCYITTVVTVSPMSTPITGSPNVCIGAQTTLSNSMPGGTWTSSNTAIADVGSATGVVSGISTGTATISYSVTTGCMTTIVVTVSPSFGSVTGVNVVCVGSITTLYSSTTGGTWVSGSPFNAGVSPGGIVSGVSAGTSTISYVLAGGCSATLDVTVNPLPAAITGINPVCEGLTATLSDISTGGTWSSSNPAIAAVDPAGVVTGTGGGNATITYTLSTGCFTTLSYTVNSSPGVIGGSHLVCAGFMSNLTSSLSGGIWSMTGSPVVATIHPLTGVVTGISPGTISVTYTLGAGCDANTIVTVTALPPAITGVATICEAGVSTLADAVTGGTWVSADPSIATADLLSGGVSGMHAGEVTITYTIATGCINIRNVTVNPLPAPISGPTVLCKYATSTLSSATPGGAWTSGNMLVAGVGLVSGVVTGASPGTANISYTTVATGCARQVTVTVNGSPGAILGSPYACIGSNTTLSSIYGGGTWSSSNTTVATINAATGVVTGHIPGTAVINYTLSSATCPSTLVVTVSAPPNSYTVTGGGSYCAGGPGVHIGLSGSQGGVSYLLSYGSSATGYLAGTGSALDFGLLTVAGTYTVLATNAVTGCSHNMTGSAVVTINPSVTPSVAVTTPTGATLCPGGPHTFTAAPVNSGTTPAYIWRVNGLTVGSGTTYSFIPASGDVVSVTMTSNASCAVPNTAVGTMTVTVIPAGMPTASITADPGDTVCQFSLTHYVANGTFGGSAPIYIWLVNGSIAGSGATFSYEPVNNDLVQLKMISNYQCRLADTVVSGDMVMAVDSMIVPHVTISATPGLMVNPGQTVTLNTTVTNAGALPTYQWKVNGVPVPGATNPSYTSTFNHYDSVTCLVTSDGWCKDITTFDWVFISVVPLGVQQANLNGDLMLLPNPNKGEFIIRGSLGVFTDEELTAEVTNMLGQVVYKTAFISKNGRVEERIRLNNTLANGMYLLNVQTRMGNKVFHFVLEQ